MNSIILMSGNDCWYHNPTSPIQIAKKLSQDNRVLFVNSITLGMPSLHQKDFTGKLTRKFKSYLKFYRKLDANFHVLSPVTIPIYGRPSISALNRLVLKLQIRLGLCLAGMKKVQCIVANPMFVDALEDLDCNKLLYFVTDKYDAKELPSKEAVIEADRKLAEKADVIVCVSHTLYDYYKANYEKVILITHGVDYEHFSIASEDLIDCPADIRGLRKPIVGFMGGVDAKTSDPDLLEYLFKRNPEKSFVFLGRLTKRLNYLNRYSNVHFLGQKTFEELPSYLKQFDVALMPFNNSEWIKYCNPIKLKEYLAAGLPIVSINIKEAEPYGDLVYLASSYEEFHEMLSVALAEDSIELRRARKERVSTETWAEKVNQIKSLL